MASRPLKKCRLRVSSRAKRGISLFLTLCAFGPIALWAQTKRPKILGIGRVVIQDNITPAGYPLPFYRELRLGDLGSFQAGATAVVTYGVIDHQELILIAGPMPDLGPQAPPRNTVVQILFQTSDVMALHDYLQSKQVEVGDVTEDSTKITGADGKPVLGDPLLFPLKDPDGNLIGFVQYKLPLKLRREEGQISSRLIHAGFVVHDRAAMEHFYKDILGFRVYWHGGMRDDETDWIDLQVSEGTDWIEFMLNVPPDAEQRLWGVMNHIALGVPDIHAAEQQLLKNGMQFTERPKIGRDGKWQLNLYDPDGTRIELMEFTPVEKPCCSDYTGPHPRP